MTTTRRVNQRSIRLVLLGNYLPDGQESMRRYAEVLAEDAAGAGIDVRAFTPPKVAGRARRQGSSLSKWLGYVDKYVLFPVMLLGIRAREHVAGRLPVYHICDHSNAPWLRVLPRSRTVVTCHDVLAIRGSRGDLAAHAPASRAGRLLQRYILRSLLHARFVACVSERTRQLLHELACEEPQWSASDSYRTVIPNPFNADFRPLDEDSRSTRLAEVGLSDGVPFLLHVGSAHPRKNRSLLVDLMVDGQKPWSGLVCFAGDPIDRELQRKIVRADVERRVVEVHRPEHGQLVALYQSCAAFVFPSLSEGFGWPVIEAQRAGAVVLTSDREPLPEVGGAGALYADPTDARSFIAALAVLDDEVAIGVIRSFAVANADRFENARIIAQFRELYLRVCRASDETGSTAPSD